MTIHGYGVWAGLPTRCYTEHAGDHDPTPHIYLYFRDDNNSDKEREAAINVKSRGEDSRLVLWKDENYSHPITAELAELDLGFHLITQTLSSRFSGFNNPRVVHGLDYLRPGDILPSAAGLLVPFDVPPPQDDILREVQPVLQNAIEHNATIYIFGSSFGSGIHDIHMNQGSQPPFENGVGEDGALLIKYPSGSWTTVFIAFASQKVPTDDRTGDPLPESHSFANMLEH